MDNFMNLAKAGYEAYSDSQSNVSKTGGQELNSPHHSQQQGGQGYPNINHDEVVQTAAEHGGDPSMFKNALGFLHENSNEHNNPIDEEHVQNAHQKAYGDESPGDLSASSMGSAAALQILKQFTSGGSGGSQTQLISMAMAEASNLFDKSGGASSGNKQDAVNGAAMTVMKLMVQSKFSGGGTTGGGSSGGLGSLMSLASKFA